MSSMQSLPPEAVQFETGKRPSINRREQVIEFLLALAGAVPLLIIAALIVVFAYQSWQFFQVVPLWNFLTDTQWTPRFSSEQFGIGVLISATVMISAIAMAVAMPLGLLSALYLSEYAATPVRRVLKPLLESLSGVPTIVFGYFALLFVTPNLQALIPNLAFFNSLSAGIVTGILIVPIVASLSEDALRNVPKIQRQAAYACGFTRQEMLLRILMPAALPGIMASFTLAASRALGETMIAAIAAGQNPSLTLNPLVPVETMTAFIVQVSLGDVPTGTLIFHTIFAVGAVLFLLTLGLNSLGNWLVWRYQKSTAGRELPAAVIQADGAADLQVEVVTNAQDPQFKPRLRQRRWLDRALTGLGFVATLVGPLVFGLLVLVTFRSGFSQLNWQFLTSFTSYQGEKAGIAAALAGTLWLLGLTIAFALPIGLAAAIYLEEYLPKGPWSRLIEVNLANATAVPGILYGLLGLALFAKQLGGITGGRSILSASLMMTLLVLPLLITAARTALRSVPTDLKKGGYAVGMSRWQVTWHITLPAALPGIVTGLLLSFSRIVGETSPLIALGAVEFIVFAPDFSWEGLQSPFTTLTTQIFFWLARPQPIFQAKAAAAVLVLGLILIATNALAGLVRDRLARFS